MGPFTLDDDDKLQCDDIVVYWVLYPFHDDVVMTLLSSSPSANESLMVTLETSDVTDIEYLPHSSTAPLDRCGELRCILEGYRLV